MSSTPPSSPLYSSRRRSLGSGTFGTDTSEGDNSPRSEDVLWQLGSAMLDGVVLSNPNGIILDINASAEKMFEVDRADVLGKDVSILVPPEQRAHHLKAISHYRTTNVKKLLGKPRSVMGWKHKQERAFPVEISLGEKASPEGKSLGFVAVFRDARGSASSSPPLSARTDSGFGSCNNSNNNGNGLVCPGSAGGTLGSSKRNSPVTSPLLDAATAAFAAISGQKDQQIIQQQQQLLESQHKAHLQIAVQPLQLPPTSSSSSITSISSNNTINNSSNNNNSNNNSINGHHHHHLSRTKSESAASPPMASRNSGASSSSATSIPLPVTFQNTTIIRQGFLLRLSSGLLKKWSSKWLVLTRNTIFVFSDAQSFMHGSKPKSSMNLQGCSVRPTVDVVGREHSFGIFMPTGQRMLLQALTEDEMMGWIRSIQYHCLGMSLEVGLSDFDLLCVVGHGSFGKVLQVRHKESGQIMALKVLNKKDMLQSGSVDATRREQRVMEAINHPFIVRMHYSFQTDMHLCFVMDFINGGELFRFIQAEGHFSESRSRFYASEVLLALEYLHSIGIIYRDLKPENVMLDSDGHVCLTDFGLSKDAVQFYDRTFSVVGSPFYMAPEIVSRTGHDMAVDWWSFGILVYEMLVGLPPFYQQNFQIAYHNILTKPVPIPSSMSVPAAELVTNLLKQDPRMRLGGGPKGAEEVKEHHFFAGLDWTRVLTKQMRPEFVPPVKSSQDVTNLAVSSCVAVELDLEERADTPTKNMLDKEFEEFRPFNRASKSITNSILLDADMVSCHQFLQSCDWDLHKVLLAVSAAAANAAEVKSVLGGERDGRLSNSLQSLSRRAKELAEREPSTSADRLASPLPSSPGLSSAGGGGGSLSAFLSRQASSTDLSTSPIPEGSMLRRPLGLRPARLSLQ